MFATEIEGKGAKMKFIEKDVEYNLTVEPDDMPVRGNALASGDDSTDKKYEDEIIDRLNRGDVWAWATVKVTAHWNGLEGTDYLSGCCYQDEKDFKRPGGYYADMKKEALEALKQHIKELQAKVCGAQLI